MSDAPWIGPKLARDLLDTFTIRERLEQLQKQIEQLQQEDRVYKKQGHRRAPMDIRAHETRLIRMRQIVDEINELTKKQKR